MNGDDQTQDLLVFDGENDIQADNTNIAARMKDDDLDKIGDWVVRCYDADIKSRTDFDTWRAKWLKAVSGFLEEKNTPWHHAANTTLHFILVACLQFYARAYKALIGKDIVKCYSKDGLQKDKAKRAENYMNWQLRFDMCDFLSDMRRSLVALPLDGTIFKKTYPDYETKQPVSMFLMVDEFVVNYRTRSLNNPRTRKTHILWLEIDLIKDRIENKIFLDAYPNNTLVPEDSKLPGNMPETREMQDRVEGTTEPETEFSDKRNLLEQHVYLDLNYDPKEQKLKKKDGKKRPYIVTVDYTTRKVLRIVSREVWNPDRNRFDVLEYFTPYFFIPNPNSIYAFGFGQLLFSMSEAANTALNQLLDAGHLNNIVAGFINRRAGLRRGDMGFEMGVFKEVDIMAPDIRNAIYQFQFKEPSRVLFQLIGLLFEHVQRVGSTPEALMGKIPPSDTAATSMLAAIEQGLVIYSVLQEGMHDSFRQELEKIFAINHDVLDETVYAMVQDHTSREFQTLQSGKGDFASKIGIIPVSDPNITSRAEKLIKAQTTLAEAKQNPLMTNPRALYPATVNYLGALEAPAEVIDGVTRPDQAQPPPPDLPPEQENAMFLKEQSTPVLPQQNHKKHLENHEGFRLSHHFEQMTPHGKKLHEAHEREHMAHDYLQEEQARKAIVSQMGGA